MATVVLIGTLDTKGDEYALLRERLRSHGVATLVVDAGIVDEPRLQPDVNREAVAEAGGADIATLRDSGDRGAAVEVMSRGAAAIAADLHHQGRLHGLVGLGGSGGSAIVSAAARALPVGVPKLLVSTLASGDTRPYVDVSDLTLMPSIVDVAGINRVSRMILENAAAAVAGMVSVEHHSGDDDRPLVAATMFGVTTPCVDAARRRLEELGHEVLVFHATGTGGRSMESLVRQGLIAGVLDITTTELADELVGGVLSAGPERLEAAGEVGIPQVVSLGALDMVNFGPRDTVPSRFANRTFYEHNPTVTLMRTTPEECAELGRVVARKLNRARGPVTLFVPLRGVSAIAVEGQVFHDPEADRVLLEALRAHLDEHVDLRERDTHINDLGLAREMADALVDLHGRTARAETRRASHEHRTRPSP